MARPPDAPRAAPAMRRRADGEPSARALLFTVLGSHVVPAGGEAWSATLVAALGALGVEEKAARQAIARSAADGWIEGESAGRYTRWRVTAAGQRVLAEARGRFAHSIGSHEAWDGDWVTLVVRSQPADRSERARLLTRLRFEGFAPLEPSVWLAAEGRSADAARAVFDELGLGPDAALVMRGRLNPVAGDGPVPSGAERDLARRLWDLDAAATGHEDFLRRFPGPAPDDPAVAFALRVRLVHEWRQLLGTDPALPSALLPADWAGERARERFNDLSMATTPLAESFYASLTAGELV